MIIGKWRASFNIENELRSMSEAEKEAYGQLDEKQVQARIEEMKKAMVTNQYIFRRDSTYQILVQEDTVSQGKWYVNLAQDTLYTINNQNTINNQTVRNQYFIQTLTAEEMNLVAESANPKALYLISIQKK